MSYLNVISTLGLAAMILIAWTMSSFRKRIDWRLVVLGVCLQLVFAAIFFNSQRWTFSQTQSFDSAEELLKAVAAGDVIPEAVQFFTTGNPSNPQSLSALMAAATIEGKGPFALELELNQWLVASGNQVEVARFPNGIVFDGVQSFFEMIQDSVAVGRDFVFQAHPPAQDSQGLIGTFAFGILPTVIFFASLMSVLYYLGVMQGIVRGMAWLMQKTLRTTAVESLAAAANVFVGHTEAPLVVKPYIARMTRSELNALMVGGFSTISGSLMAVYASQGISAGHLLTASIISAPAALVIAKILLPETQTPESIDNMMIDVPQGPSNVIEAAAIGASEGMKLAINIGAMLIAFLALIALMDFLLGGIGSLAGFELSLDRIFGWLFSPLAWVMGISGDDCAVAGNLLGKKMVVNEFVAYLEMQKVSVDAFAEGTGITERTRVILTYALCGFSNFGAIGIQIGGIGPLAPNRRSDLARLGLRAMFGGMLAACMTACIAGIFYGILG